MPARRPFRSQWVPGAEPKPEPLSPHAQKARSLPRPGPGIVVTVPLHLLPEYLAIYQLVPSGIQEPNVPRRDGPGEAILLVKRAKTDGTS